MALSVIGLSLASLNPQYIFIFMKTLWSKALMLLILAPFCLAQFHMTIRTADGTIHAFAVEDIEELTFDGVLTLEDGKNLAALLNNFSLLQNYPNPFNPTTTIEYTLANSGRGSITVYNMLGQKVSVFDFQHSAPGTYHFNWTGQDDLGRPLASGIYVYQMKFDGQQESKRLLLLR
jgi:hypothetical protein